MIMEDNLPTECKKCGGSLELDQYYDKNNNIRHRLICNDCGFTLDVTDILKQRIATEDAAATDLSDD